MLSGDRAMMRVSKRRPCGVCGKPDWCGYSLDERLAVCMRVAEGAVKQTRNGGYLHVLRDDPDWQARLRVRTVPLDGDDPSKTDFGRMVADHAAATDMAELQNFADELGLLAESLVRLSIGWAAKYRSWSFPMRNAGMSVRGIRLRSWAGRKWAVMGSREGLFIPAGLDFGTLLLACEGPTDTAALLDLGFSAVGRPSCIGGVNLLAELVQRNGPPGVVIVADADAPGRRGAEAIASRLLPLCRSVRVIYPPDGITDARAWKQAGATHDEVKAVIDAAPVRALRAEQRMRT